VLLVLLLVLLLLLQRCRGWGWRLLSREALCKTWHSRWGQTTSSLRHEQRRRLLGATCCFMYGSSAANIRITVA
jgi:hypothetical protein